MWKIVKESVALYFQPLRHWWVWLICGLLALLLTYLEAR